MERKKIEIKPGLPGPQKSDKSKGVFTTSWTRCATHGTRYPDGGDCPKCRSEEDSEEDSEEE
jgi:hypothetical protein